MSLFRYKDYEDGTLTPYFSTSTTPPTIVDFVRGDNTKAMQTTCIVEAQYVLRDMGYNSILVEKFYLHIADYDTVFASNLGIHSVMNDTQARNAQVNVVTDGLGGMWLRWAINDGSNVYYPGDEPILPYTTYRIEVKHDWSGASMKLSWGMAIDDAALVTKLTDYTGGNTGTGVSTYWSYDGINSVGWILRTRFTEHMWGNEASDYPIGPSVRRPTINSVIRSNARR